MSSETAVQSPSAAQSASARYAYLGPAGTFSHAAAQALTTGIEASLIPHSSVTQAIDALRAGTVTGAIVPLENSVEGGVPATLDELAGSSTPLIIAAELFLPVVFDLLVRPGTTSDDVSTIATHPHAEAQVRRYLLTELPGTTTALVGSTAAGAEAVRDGEYDAAVAPAIAGRLYGLDSLEHDIADNPGAVTRFVLLTKPAVPPAPTGNDRTTLVAYLRYNRSGALLEILTEFGGRGVNLTRIESRPTKGSIGQYSFSIDCEGHIEDARVGEALTALHRLCAEVRYLGSYPRQDGQQSPVPAGRTDPEFTRAAAWLERIRTTGGA